MTEFSKCGCRFENNYSSSVILCEECSKLPCHNKEVDSCMETSDCNKRGGQKNPPTSTQFDEKQGNTIDFVQARQIAELGNEQMCISPDGETLYPFSIEYEAIPGRRTHLPFYARDREHAREVFELIKQGKIAEERTVKWIT